MQANGGKFSFNGLTPEEQWKAMNEILNGQIAEELARLDASYPEDDAQVAPPPKKPGEGLVWARVPKAEAMQREALRLSAWKQGCLADIKRLARGEKPL